MGRGERGKGNKRKKGEKERREVGKKKPVAQRQAMVIGTLAPPLVFQNGVYCVSRAAVLEGTGGDKVL